jgi:hypothetical protein
MACEGKNECDLIIKKSVTYHIGSGSMQFFRTGDMIKSIRVMVGSVVRRSSNNLAVPSLRDL